MQRLSLDITDTDEYIGEHAKSPSRLFTYKQAVLEWLVRFKSGLCLVFLLSFLTKTILFLTCCQPASAAKVSCIWRSLLNLTL